MPPLKLDYQKTVGTQLLPTAQNMEDQVFGIKGKPGKKLVPFLQSEGPPHFSPLGFRSSCHRLPSDEELGPHGRGCLGPRPKAASLWPSVPTQGSLKDLHFLPAHLKHVVFSAPKTGETTIYKATFRCVMQGSLLFTINLPF